MKKPRVLLLGPLIGRNPGFVTTQGEKVTDLLLSAGFEVSAVSSALNRYVRLAEIVRALLTRHQEVDVVILFVYGGKSFVLEDIASFIAKRLGLPVVMMLCGGRMPAFIETFPSWNKRVLARASRIACQSEYLAKEVRALGLDPTLVANVIDLDSYPHTLRRHLRPRLFWMRTFEDYYNPEMALQVLAAVRRRHPDATLVMAGQDSGLLAATKARANQLGIADAVRFPGFLDMEGKIREAQAADIFLNTPMIDNRPLCVVEAAAFGLPVVTTNVGGIPHLVEHESTALLVANNDVGGMTRAVERLLADDTLAARLSSRGRTLAEQSAATNVLPLWSQLLSEAARSAS